MLKTLILETLHGKTLPRILMNLEIKDYTQKNPIEGQVIDLGSKSNGMSYNRFLAKQDCEITYTDIEGSAKNVKTLNLEKEFNLGPNSYDRIMCFNTLEHIFNFKNVIKESFKILKKDGVFIGSTPFLIQYHPDPNDYFRYTHAALEKLFTEEGFKKVLIHPMGIGYLSTGLYQLVMVLPKIIRPFVLIPLIWMDKLLNLIARAKDTNRYALGYFFVFKK